MVVLTLVGSGIKPGAKLILTECGMAQLENGDKLHCSPDFANAIKARYPENLKQEGKHYERPGELKGKGGHYEYEKGSPKAATAAGATEAPPAKQSGKAAK